MSDVLAWEFFYPVPQLTQLKEEVLEQLIDRELLYQQSRKKGIKVDEKAINEQLKTLKQWGFVRHGIKMSSAGEEGVWVRSLERHASEYAPASTYPLMSSTARKCIVPIYPQYHTELLPDSILRTESPMDFIENRPNRNAIRKAYISR